jgi:hypothetical protein
MLTDLNLKCTWVEGENKEGEAQCQKVRKTCEEILTAATCGNAEAAGDKKCIWVENETDGPKCEEVKNSCEEITVGRTTCEFKGAAYWDEKNISCIWIEAEENNYKCEPIKNLCSDITRGPITCEYEGTALPQGDSTPLECVWLLDVDATETELKGRCKIEVNLFI